MLSTRQWARIAQLQSAWLGAPGGLAMERGSPADSAVFVGDKTAAGRIHSMPFYQGVDNDAERYSQSSAESGTSACVFDEAVFGGDKYGFHFSGRTTTRGS